MNHPKKNSSIKIPRWQLHRGYWKKGVRENTMSAFKEAKKHNCEMVELDVQVSRDGVPHVYHDFKLDRFFHIDEHLKKQKSEDLQGLNIPTLQEVLLSDEVPSYLNVELKSIELFCLWYSKKINHCLNLHGKTKHIFVSSFNPMCLFWMKFFNPEQPRALLVGDKESLFNWKFRISMFLAKPHFINARHTLFEDEESFKKMVSCKRPLVAWTVNNEAKARHLMTQGAVSVISDFPPTSNL